MLKLIHTLFLNIRAIFTEYFLPEAVICALAALIFICRTAVCARRGGKSIIPEIKESSASLCGVCILVFYTAAVLNATVISRLNMPPHEPLSNIFGGWTAVETEYFYDLSAIWNIVIFMPLCAVIAVFASASLKRRLSIKKLSVISFAAGLMFSAAIEVLQIILKAGTFQIADIFYNALGAALGVPLFAVISRAVKEIVKRKKLRITNKNPKA